MLPYLPVEHDGPVQRLRTVHSKLNSHGRITSAQARPSWIWQQPPAHVVRQGSSTCLADFRTRHRHTGDQRIRAAPRLGLMGKTVQRLLPIPPTASQLSSGVAVLSYGDELVFGITADYEAALELALLAAGIEQRDGTADGAGPQQGPAVHQGAPQTSVARGPRPAPNAPGRQRRRNRTLTRPRRCHHREKVGRCPR